MNDGMVNSRLKRLEWVDLSRTRVGERGAQSFKNALPQCMVIDDSVN